jgi:hypothetical protein
VEDSDSEIEYHDSNNSQEVSDPEYTPSAVSPDDSVAQGRGHSKALVQKLSREVMSPIDTTFPMLNANLISVQFGRVRVRLLWSTLPRTTKHVVNRKDNSHLRHLPGFS